MPNPSFLPIGLPRDATSNDSVDERVGMHLLEALDSLDTLYKSAAFFAGVSDEHALADFTLSRCLDAVRSDTGALFLVDDTGLHLAAERNDGASRIRVEELAQPTTIAHAALWNGDEGARIVSAPGTATGLAATNRSCDNALTTPIHVGNRLAGMVVALAPAKAPFSTADAKLIAAVASQAAIALGRTRHWHEIEVERQKLQLVVQNHPEGIVVLNRHGETILCNPIARELLGSDDALAVLGRIDPSCSLATLLATRTERELTLPGPGTARVVAVKSRPVQASDDAVHNVVLTIRDLTRLRREERLKRNFVSLLSHKLRTPLTALTCAMHMLDGSPPQEQTPLLQEMSHRVNDLGGLIDRLFQFTDLLEGSWTRRGSCDLQQLATELSAQYAASPRAPELTFDVASAARTVPLPAPRIRLALQNLIDNAVKFSPGPRPFVRVTAQAAGDRLVIEVEDRGPGIPASEQADILSTFHQVDREFTGDVAGAGLGLAMVREIVNRIGGTLELRPATPKGCVFTLSLPAQPTADAGEPR